MASTQKILADALASAVKSTQNPGAVAYVGDMEKALFWEAFGLRQRVPVTRSASVDTIYDLASLTKVIATTTATLLLHQDGLIDLDAPITEYLPIPEFGTLTCRHLLTHTSGLAAGRPYYKQASTVTEMIQLYAEDGLDWTPGTRRRYSDAGFMILGRIVEFVARDRLDAFCTARIFKPLEMAHTCFNPPADWAEGCAATEQCAWRKKLIQGVVHDENAYAVGGIAGHAGLFSNAKDLATFCRALLGGKLLTKGTLDRMTRIGQVPCYPWQGLGWWLDPWATGTDGYLFSRAAFGHSGWTGTCLWMDRESGRFAILLGNTCHPSRSQRNNPEFRRTFFDGVAKAFWPDKVTTHTGLDRIMREDFQPLRGRRVALLTHHAAVDQMGRHALDVFALAPDVKLHVIFSPEHGLRGEAEAGASVPSENGPAPVVSLMGDRTAPSDDELAEIDYFVVDLQDVGARYYTYAATMKACLQACRRAGKPVIVLDRPNPTGGIILEGPIAEDEASPVCWGRVPVRHALTMGELAVFFAKQLGTTKRFSVAVHTLDNWRRDRLFTDCSLPWVAPSPNIPTPETTLAYVGMCLFEGTNLNEGRGSETPFMVIGAPWLDPPRIIEHLQPDDCRGCRLEPVRYTPRSISGKASAPRFRDETCEGIRIHLTDPRGTRSFRLAVALIIAIRRAHPRRFQWQTNEWFDALAGTPRLRERIEQGDEAHDILRALEPELELFAKAAPRRYA